MLAPASATIHTVRADGSGQFATIQAAIDSPLVVAGDVIELEDGEYMGEGNRGVSFRGKAITVRSQSGSPEACIIDCMSLDSGFHFEDGEGADSVLDGVTITNGVAYIGAGVNCSSESSPTIANCVIRDCSAEYGAGIYCFNIPELNGCVFYNNHAVQEAGAITCTGPDPITITSCTFVANSSSWGGAITSIYGDLTIENSIIASCAEGEAVACSPDGTAELHCCCVYGNAEGDWVDCIAGQASLNGNISADPLLCDVGSGNVALCANSPCREEASGCGAAIGARGTDCPECDAPVSAVSWGVLKRMYRGRGRLPN
jgi:hypothetical protein